MICSLNYANHVIRFGNSGFPKFQVLIPKFGLSTLSSTLLLMGNLASQWQQDKWWFVAGAISASVIWFVGVSTLTAKFAHHMQRPRFWRWFNRANAAVLGLVSVQLASL